MKIELASKIKVFNAFEMIELGYHVASIMQGTEIIFLQGSLGAGKTTFVKGFGKALGIPEEIISPTFVLLREYFGSCPLYHFDLYRLENIKELNQIGFSDLLAKKGIKLVEWADQFQEIESEADWKIKFKLEGESIRQVEFYEYSF